MRVSVLLSHPYSGSFNHAIYKQVCISLKNENIKVFCHDLYEEGFDPVLTVGELGKAPTRDALVRRYADELMLSDLLVFIHPNWWGQPPAMLKGYIDRVIRPPYAYDMPEGAEGGLPIPGLEGKYGIVFNTSNTEAGREKEYFGDPLENIWEKCVFGFCGIRKYHRRMFRIVCDSTEEERKGWLRQVDDDIRRVVKDLDI